MNPLVLLLGICLAAAAMFALFVAVERWLRRPGLAFLLAAVSGVVVAAFSFADGKRLVPTLLILQAIGFFVHARWLRSVARESLSQ